MDSTPFFAKTTHNKAGAFSFYGALVKFVNWSLATREGLLKHIEYNFIKIESKSPYHNLSVIESLKYSSAASLEH